MRGAVSIALAYNQASCGNCFFWSSVFSSELYFKIQIRAVFVRESWIKEREMALMSYLIDFFSFGCSLQGLVTLNCEQMQS